MSKKSIFILLVTLVYISCGFEHLYQRVGTPTKFENNECEVTDQLIKKYAVKKAKNCSNNCNLYVDAKFTKEFVRKSNEIKLCLKTMDKFIEYIGTEPKEIKKSKDGKSIFHTYYFTNIMKQSEVDFVRVRTDISNNILDIY